MGIIEKLPFILSESREEYNKIKSEEACFELDSLFGEESENILAIGDNISFMRYLETEKELDGKLQLIYIDPPFFSHSNYGTDIKISSEKLGSLPKIKQFAYCDMWEEGMEAYLKMLAVRFLLMKDLLSDTGCLFVHLDWHVVHYVKILLDEIFGEKNFVNEIIWNYKSGGSSSRHFARKHDTILFYSKTKNYLFIPQKEKSYNRKFKPYRFKGVHEYRDENGWYTMVNMKDVWQIDMVGRTSSERTGYATQKPEALLRRIVESCTRPGDIAADFFGGSGTLSAVCEKTGRRWIYSDIGTLAACSAEKRLADEKSSFKVIKQSFPEHRIHTCELDAECFTEKAGLSDDLMLTVRLTGYKPGADSEIPVRESDLKEIKRAVKKDPLRFIEFWSIDYSYDGSVHKSDDAFFRRGNELKTEATALGKEFKNIHIKAYDIFGNEAEFEFKPDAK